MRLVCPLFSVPDCFLPSPEIKHQLISLPPARLHSVSSIFPRGGKKKELEALKLRPPPFIGEIPVFFFLKGGGGLRLQKNKEPHHHGVWILAETWGPGGWA